MRPEGAEGDYIALSLPSKPHYLGLLRTVVGRAADLFGFEEEETQSLMLAVNEGCANIIRHCYKMSPDKKIDVTLRILEDRFEVDLRDYGTYRELDQAESLCGDEAEPGGLGLRIMRDVMDEVEFRPAEREGTLLTMVKYRRQGE